jgi:hypothetical protein
MAAGTTSFVVLLLPPECATEGQFIRVMWVPIVYRAVMGLAHLRALVALHHIDE